jgi:hypothetical protein
MRGEAIRQLGSNASTVHSLRALQLRCSSFRRDDVENPCEMRPLDWHFHCTFALVMVWRPRRNSPDLRQPRLAWISNVHVHVPGSSETSRDALFNGLEGRTVRIFDRVWEVRVYSISEDERGRWLQLSLDGDPDYAVTIGSSPSTGPERIARALTRWLARQSKSSTLLHVS